MLEDPWADNAIGTCVDKGILNGYEDGTLRPNGKVTRNEFAKMMVEGLNIPKRISTESSFSDITPWARDYVEAAKDYLSGYDEDGQQLFRGNDAAIREDMAAALVKALNLDISEYDIDELASIFSDWESISPENMPYVLTASKEHLINGYPGGWFGPGKTITRAETAMMITNVIKSEKMTKVLTADLLIATPSSLQ